jgi:hypothetical protein
VHSAVWEPPAGSPQCCSSDFHRRGWNPRRWAFNCCQHSKYRMVGQLLYHARPWHDDISSQLTWSVHRAALSKFKRFCRPPTNPTLPPPTCPHHCPPPSPPPPPAWAQALHPSGPQGVQPVSTGHTAAGPHTPGARAAWLWGTAHQLCKGTTGAISNVVASSGIANKHPNLTDVYEI